MRRKDLNRKQKNILIGSLLAVVVLMAVGYAAFSTSLNINGTASVSSTWDIKITSVTANNIVGSASDNTDVTTFSNLSATVAANLVSPGDSIRYDILVTNNGSIDAKLDTITEEESNNDAIKMRITGLSEGEKITAGSTKLLSVKIEYKSNVTSQPNSTTAAFTISLSFSQYVAQPITYVYAWPESRLFYGGKRPPNSSSISPSYNSFAAMSTATGKNYGLKYGIENGKITEAYACGLWNGQEFCLQASMGSMYVDNKVAMEAFFTGSNGSCDNCNSTTCYCSGGGLNAIATFEGAAYVRSDDGSCNILASGTICRE